MNDCTNSMLLSPRDGAAPLRSAGRGIAMLLVIVCLATLAVMTAALLSAHGNAGAIAENATEAAETELAAKAAADLAEAVLQSDVDLTPAQIETIFQDLNLNGMTLTAEATDFEGNAPSGEEESLLITINARGPSRTHTLQKTANFEPEPSAEKQLEEMDWAGGEFALFGRECVVLDHESVLTRWASSPLAENRKILKLGTNSEAASAIEIKGDSKIAGGYAYFRPSASRYALYNDTTFTNVSSKSLPSGLPIIERPINYSEAQTWRSNAAAKVTGQTFALNGTYRIEKLALEEGCVLTIRDGSQLAVDDDFNIKASTLRIEGRARIFVFDDMNLSEGSAIEVAEGARLEIFVADDFTVQDSCVGFPAALLGRGLPPSTDLPYFDPREIFIVGGHTDANKVLIDNSFVRGRIYAQLDDVTLDHNSAVYGCVLGNTLKLDHGSYVHYDHSLDPEVGYTVTDGPLYDEETGELIDGVATAVRTGNFVQAKEAALDDGSNVIEETVDNVVRLLPSTEILTVTPRVKERCIAFPRPTKARLYEGRPMAHADEEAR